MLGHGNARIVRGMVSFIERGVAQHQIILALVPPFPNVPLVNSDAIRPRACRNILACLLGGVRVDLHRINGSSWVPLRGDQREHAGTGTNIQNALRGLIVGPSPQKHSIRSHLQSTAILQDRELLESEVAVRHAEDGVVYKLRYRSTRPGGVRTTKWPLSRSIPVITSSTMGISISWSPLRTTITG